MENNPSDWKRTAVKVVVCVAVAVPILFGLGNLVLGLLVVNAMNNPDAYDEEEWATQEFDEYNEDEPFVPESTTTTTEPDCSIGFGDSERFGSDTNERSDDCEPNLRPRTVADDLGEVTRLDVESLGVPTLVTVLADYDSRYLEMELSLPRGDGDLRFAIDNPTGVTRLGQGIAVRSETQALGLNSNEVTTLRRPANCTDGCRTLVWFTMHPGFREAHPDAVLYAFADDGAEGRVEQIEIFPPEMYR